MVVDIDRVSLTSEKRSTHKTYTAPDANAKQVVIWHIIPDKQGNPLKVLTAYTQPEALRFAIEILQQALKVL